MMSDIDRSKLKVVESYVVLGERRYVVRISDTKISFNISAESEEEAIRKVLEMLSK